MTTRNAPTTAADAATRLESLAALITPMEDLRCTMTSRGLMVLRPDEDADPTVEFGPCELVSCLPRPDDGKTLWFADEDGEWLTPADDVTGASVALRGRLAP